MRILTVGNMYPPHHFGGYELMWRSWVTHMRSAGAEVRVLTTDFNLESPEPAIPEDSDIDRSLEWYWSNDGFPPRSLSVCRAIEQHNQSVLARHIDELKPEAVVWWAMGGMSLALIETVRRSGLPSVGVVVDDWLIYAPSVDGRESLIAKAGLLRGIAAAAFERSSGVPGRVRLGNAARWIFVSDAVRLGAEASGFEANRWQVEHAGVEQERFRPVPPARWRWEMLYLGRLDPRKGIDTAIRALCHLDEARLRVVGGGDAGYKRELEDLARKLGVSDRLRFDQLPRDRLQDAYGDADVVLFPVRWSEPFGLVPLEAMSVGRPVIATGTGGSGEYLRHEENCLIYRPVDDERALADAVRRMASDADLREQLIRGGSAVAARYTDERFNTAVAGVVVEEVGRG